MLSFVITKEEKTLKELFKFHRGNSPFKETQNLSKKNRIEKGLPPNKFFVFIHFVKLDKFVKV